MMISRECDYAVRIVRALADYGVKNVNEICEKELVPVQYAYKILRKLVRSGIVKSYRGVSGGYELARDTSEISLFDVVISIDSKFCLNECLLPGYACLRNKNNQCSVHAAIGEIQSKLQKLLEEKTFYELLNT